MTLFQEWNTVIMTLHQVCLCSFMYFLYDLACRYDPGAKLFCCMFLSCYSCSLILAQRAPERPSPGSDRRVIDREDGLNNNNNIYPQCLILWLLSLKFDHIFNQSINFHILLLSE